MKTSQKIIPLTEQPEYQAAISKVVEISRALSATTEKLEQCRAILLATPNPLPPAPSVIERALSLAGAAPQSEGPPVVTVAAEMQRLEAERKELHDGLTAANEAANATARSLAAKIGTSAKAAHVTAVERVLECLEALCLANKGESEVRESIEKLGYERHGLPYQGFNAIAQINDPNEDAYRYARDARQYIQATGKPA